MTDYNVLAAGDTALIVDFGNQVDLNVSAKVLALAGRLNALKIDGVIETVPTIRSLSIYYEPLAVSAIEIERQVADIIEHLEDAPATGRTCDLPVCYDPELAPDLEHVAAQCNLDPAEVIEMHSSRTYHVYMLGFLPGLAYLGDLTPELVLPRRTTPRPRIPARLAWHRRQADLYLSNGDAMRLAPDRPLARLALGSDSHGRCVTAGRRQGQV